MGPPGRGAPDQRRRRGRAARGDRPSTGCAAVPGVVGIDLRGRRPVAADRAQRACAEDAVRPLEGRRDGPRQRARETAGVHAVCGILYNHESPLRGEGFVTRRITMAVARIAAGLQDTVELGDIETARDWGWAPDYTRAMQLMLRADVPHDYVLATGISHRLSFFLAKAFAAAGIDDWTPHVVSSEGRTRAGDTNILVGDSRAAYLELGWRHTVDFDSMAGDHGAPRHGAARRPRRAVADPVTDRKVSYAQNAEDVRVWRAFRDRQSQAGLTYVDVGANEPRHLSITASLSDLGWSGLLIEADPDLAEQLRVHRPADTVVQMAAADGPGELVFFRVPGTGLGTLDEGEAAPRVPAGSPSSRCGSPPTASTRSCRPTACATCTSCPSMSRARNPLCCKDFRSTSIRPWVLCVEAVLPARPRRATGVGAAHPRARLSLRRLRRGQPLVRRGGACRPGRGRGDPVQRRRRRGARLGAGR